MVDQYSEASIGRGKPVCRKQLERKAKGKFQHQRNSSLHDHLSRKCMLENFSSSAPDVKGKLDDVLAVTQEQL